MKNYAAENVDQYIAGAPKEARPVLNELRSIIKSTIPEAQESISWGVPFYRHQGDLAGFAVYKNHVSFGGASALQKKDQERLEKEGYKTGNKVVQIKFEQKLPTTAITTILQNQEKLNTGKKI
jgi:uncharacterized protein YdhG (YjbR/CyaY superfamily)